MQRKPSHFGSNTTVARRAAARAASFASIGSTRRRAPGSVIAEPDERGDRVGDRQLVALARGAVLALDDAAGEALRADDDLHRHADEVGVGELHARARVAVVVEHVDAAPRRARRRAGRRPRAPSRPRRPCRAARRGARRTARARRATRCRARRGAPRRPRRRCARRRCRSSPSPSGARRRLRRCRSRRAPREYFVPSWNTWPTSMPRSTDSGDATARARIAGRRRSRGRPTRRP